MADINVLAHTDQYLSACEHGFGCHYGGGRQLFRDDEGNLRFVNHRFATESDWTHRPCLLTSDDDGETWSSENLVNDGASYYGGISGCIDSQGNIHVIFGRNTPTDWIMYMKWTKSTETWSSPVQIGNVGGQHSQVRIMCDSNDDMHVVSWVKPGLYSRVAYIRQNSGVWESNYTYITPDENFEQGSWHTDIDSNGNIHFMYLHSNGIYYRMKTGGGSWGSLDVISSTSTVSYPTLVVDKSDNVHAIWYDSTPTSHMVYISKPLGGSWSSEENIAGVTLLYASACVSRDGTFHVIGWNGSTNRNHLWNDGSWHYEVLSATQSGADRCQAVAGCRFPEIDGVPICIPCNEFTFIYGQPSGEVWYFAKDGLTWDAPCGGGVTQKTLLGSVGLISW